MVIKSLKLIFIHIPKTGGTTIENMFERGLGIARNEYLPSVQKEKIKTQPNYVHERLHIIKTKIFPNHPDFVNEEFNEYDSFTVIRHPYSWVLSQYNYFKLYYPLPDTLDVFIHDESHPYHLKKYQSLNQLDYLSDDDTGELMVKRIFVFEKYSRVIKFVQSKLTRKIRSIPHIYKIDDILKEKNRDRSTLTSENKQALEHYFKDDISFYQRFSNSAEHENTN